jgi:hypothetical protein
VNQDFCLTLTPANARRLRMFQNVSNIILPDDLNMIADQDMIGPDSFDQFVCPYNEEKRTITQFLLDCDLRGIVQRLYHRFGVMEIINTVRLAKAKITIVFTRDKDTWTKAAKALFVDVLICNPFQLSGEEIDKYRDGVLIIDFNHETSLSKIRSFATEFQRTILYDNQTELKYPWQMLANALFPTMPHPLYSKIVEDAPGNDKASHAFAPYYGMCLFEEFITDARSRHFLG